MTEQTESAVEKPKNFIQDIIDEDARTGRFGGKVQTRFPPEPNGYLHIGHAKSICINFGLARQNGGLCNLRFDDTNPVKEDVEYVDSIKDDVRWLGFDWGDREYYASDYFEELFEFALRLIGKGKAFVCDLSAEQVREYRGTLTEPGRESPYRARRVEESLDLFRRMRSGEFADGSRTLRAKIDMSHPNLNLRDPVMYRILHARHHRTGNSWCIYPTYDWAHGQSDSIERITHSVCTLEFEDHRPLYDWCLAELGIHHSRQIEFARLNLTYTVMSKRRLLELVEKGHVNGWDDPRMPTIAGLRRRGYTPEAIRDFAERIGVSKRETMIDAGLLEESLRSDLNRRARRAMAVLRPLKLVIDNYPEGGVEELEAVNNPEDPAMGVRRVPFSRTLYIEHDDFRESPPPKYFRLAPGTEVRLRYGYIIRCETIVKNPATGMIEEIRCTYDPQTRSGSGLNRRKVKGTIHWVSAGHAVEATVRLYDRLFATEMPGGDDWEKGINPASLEVLSGCKMERSLGDAARDERYQFERLGYFCLDSESVRGGLIFNRTATLRDTWAKIESKRGLIP